MVRPINAPPGAPGSRAPDGFSVVLLDEGGAAWGLASASADGLKASVGCADPAQRGSYPYRVLVERHPGGARCTLYLSGSTGSAPGEIKSIALASGGDLEPIALRDARGGPWAKLTLRGQRLELRDAAGRVRVELDAQTERLSLRAFDVAGQPIDTQPTWQP